MSLGYYSQEERRIGCSIQGVDRKFAGPGIHELPRHIGGKGQFIARQAQGDQYDLCGRQEHTARACAQESGRVTPHELLNGANAVAFCGEDIGKSVTALKAWIKDAKVIEITGALLENSVLDSTSADSLSDLPTKDQTRAMLLGVLSAPARQLVQIVNAPGSSLARVMNAHVEKQQEAA